MGRRWLENLNKNILTFVDYQKFTLKFDGEDADLDHLSLGIRYHLQYQKNSLNLKRGGHHGPLFFLHLQIPEEPTPNQFPASC